MFNRRLLIILSLLIVVSAVFFAWHGQSIRSHEILPVAFEHKDHQKTKCIHCHHNYIDDTGHDSCYSCHKHDQTVAVEIEKMFHDFCRDCHVEEARKGHVSGPFRICSECHHDGGRMASNPSLIKN